MFELPPGVEAMKINTVQALWMVDPAYGGLHTICDLNLYCGTLPDPGAPTSSILGVALTPGYLNEVDLSNDDWIVRSGSPFAVGFRYSWAVGDIDGGSTHIVADTDGCQPGKNMVYDSATSSWVDPCDFGVPGDFVIRVTGDVIPSKAPFGDFNADGSVDMVDFAELQRCLSAPGYTPTAECIAAFDCDRDGLVDSNDILQFVACARGPAVSVDPACGNCLPAGLCAAGLGKLLSDAKEKVRVELVAWWGYIIILVLVIVGYFAARGFLSPYLLQQDLNNWTRDAHCPDDIDTQNRLKEAMTYLRDTLGAIDPDAKACGKFLYDNEYYKCGKVLIATGSNPRGFIGHNPPGSEFIYVDNDFVTWRYFKEVLALILYAEYSHFRPEHTSDENACQIRLDTFRTTHHMQTVLPEMRHGLPEGISD